MTDTEQSDDASDNQLAFAAVSLCGNKARGDAPQWHELAAWREGILTDERAGEVLSHVANDPACFQQWLDIVEAEAFAEEEALVAADLSLSQTAALSQVSDTESVSSTPVDAKRTDIGPSLFMNKVSDVLRSFFYQSMPFKGASFAAILLAVVVAPLLQTGNRPSLQRQLDRSTDTYIGSSQGYQGSPPLSRNTRSLGGLVEGLVDGLSTSDIERLHFQYGMYEFNEQLQQAPAEQVSTTTDWQTWLAGLPEESVDCDTAADVSHCTSVATEFQQLGQWSLMNAAACETFLAQGQALIAEDFWSEQYTLYEQMRALPSVAKSRLFSPLLPELRQPAPESLCPIVTSIVAAGR